MVRLWQLAEAYVSLKPRYSIGIDPGYSGGIIVLEDGEIVEQCFTTEEDTEAVNAIMLRYYGTSRLRVTIESVHAFRGQGVSSVWTFGESFGRLLQASSLAVPSDDLVRVTPRCWQEHFGLIIPKEVSSGLSAYHLRKLKKGSHIERAGELSGWQFYHDGLADAYLIAKWGHDHWT